MKNEAGLRPMKRGFATRRSNIALRFMAALPPLHASQRLALHIREANASLTNQRFRAILYSKDGDIKEN